MSGKYGGYRDVDASQWTDAPVVVTDEQAALAARAVAGHPMTANAGELSELLDMLGLDAQRGSRSKETRRIGGIGSE